MRLIKAIRAWLERGPSDDQAETEWWERSRRLESRMDALEMDHEVVVGNVKRALALLGKRAKALEERESGGNGHEPNGGEGSLSPQDRGRILREYRNRSR